MLSFLSIPDLRRYLDAEHHQTVGFVPTMGALHAGHRRLIEQARQQNDRVVVSIFVNPLQFAPTEDLDRYPRPLELDQQLCVAAGVDALFLPTPDALGTGGEIYQVVPPASLTNQLCGKSRPGHFTGVATIVTKLLNIVQPTRAYFGQKDAQQLAIMRRLVTDLNMSVQIVACPIVREKSGLAISSRNQYLSPAGRTQAAVIYRSLQQAQQLVDQGAGDARSLLAAVQMELDTVPEFQLEYLELVDVEKLQPIEIIRISGLLAIAGRLENTRLIDNIIISNFSPPQI